MQLKEPLLKQGSTVTVMASLTECFTRYFGYERNLYCIVLKGDRI